VHAGQPGAVYIFNGVVSSVDFVTDLYILFLLLLDLTRLDFLHLDLDLSLLDLICERRRLDLRLDFLLIERRRLDLRLDFLLIERRRLDLHLDFLLIERRRLDLRSDFLRIGFNEQRMDFRLRETFLFLFTIYY
jgi:hypothetical protein